MCGQEKYCGLTYRAKPPQLEVGIVLGALLQAREVFSSGMKLADYGHILKKGKEEYMKEVRMCQIIL